MHSISDASNIAKDIKRRLSAAIKQGDLPKGAKPYARKREASMMVAIEITVVTPTPERFHTGEIDAYGFTGEGEALLRVIAEAIAPYGLWRDNDMCFMKVHVDGHGVPEWVERGKTGPDEEPPAAEEDMVDLGDRPYNPNRPTVRRVPGFPLWVVDLDGMGRTGPLQPGMVQTSSHADALDFLDRRPDLPEEQRPAWQRPAVGRSGLTLVHGGRAG